MEIAGFVSPALSGQLNLVWCFFEASAVVACGWFQPSQRLSQPWDRPSVVLRPAAGGRAGGNHNSLLLQGAFLCLQLRK